MDIVLAADIHRTPAELADAVRRVAEHDPAISEVQGARAAFEWLTGFALDTPLTAVRRPVAGNLQREAVEAACGAEGIGNADPAYARGVEAILYWALGVSPLPGWLRAAP